MKYIVRKRCQWRTFIILPAGDESDGPKVIDESELKTSDGKRLDPETVAFFVRRGSLVEVKEEPSESPA